MAGRYSIEFYNARVLAAVEGWPRGIAADFLRLAELLQEIGPDLRLPHSRALVVGCSSCAHASGKALAGRSMAFWWGSAS